LQSDDVTSSELRCAPHEGSTWVERSQS
jgi:hypothetical protein